MDIPSREYSLEGRALIYGGVQIQVYRGEMIVSWNQTLRTRIGRVVFSSWMLGRRDETVMRSTSLFGKLTLRYLPYDDDEERIWGVMDGTMAEPFPAAKPGISISFLSRVPFQFSQTGNPPDPVDFELNQLHLKLTNVI